MNNTCYVYMILDPRTDEIIYIGKGKNKRYLFHENIAKSDRVPINAKLNNKLKKILSMGLSPIYEFPYINLSSENAYFIERYYIDSIGLLNLCNLKDGGNEHISFSEESLMKMSKSQKARWSNMPEEEKEKWSKHLSDMNMGHIVTEETKKILSEKSKRSYIEKYGEKRAKEIIDKHRDVTLGQKRPKQSESLKGRIPWNKGKKIHSDEFKEKQRIRFLENNPNKSSNEETRHKISKSKTGKKINLIHTDEFKKNLSERMKKYWEKKRNEKEK